MRNGSKNTPHNDSKWLKLVRFYTFNFPIDKGKGRVFNFAKKFCRAFPHDVEALTKDGRKLNVSFRDWAEDAIYFLGIYEKFCTEIVARHVKKGDVCLDVGANIGWYSTLFQKLVGKTGEIHSFEPVPQLFAELEKNVALNRSDAKIYLNNFGLGDEEKNLEMHFFPDLPTGHSSLIAPKGENSSAIPVKIKTLDSYLTENRIERVDFVKVDIEGAELMFLKGAGKLFEQEKPPVIFMEMALGTSVRFGYKPNDLLNYIKEKAAYEFFALDEINQKLSKIEKFEGDDIGANVLCLPANYDRKYEKI
jgi:FkbM family methyltransferase